MTNAEKPRRWAVQPSSLALVALCICFVVSLINMRSIHRELNSLNSRVAKLEKVNRPSRLSPEAELSDSQSGEMPTTSSSSLAESAVEGRPRTKAQNEPLRVDGTSRDSIAKIVADVIHKKEVEQADERMARWRQYRVRNLSSTVKPSDSIRAFFEEEANSFFLAYDRLHAEIPLGQRTANPLYSERLRELKQSYVAKLNPLLEETQRSRLLEYLQTYAK